MNTDLLKAFIAVHESGSVAEAATKLCKTQSAVTKGIQRLEAHLGGPLFDRDGYRLALNRRGKLLLNNATELVRKERELFQLSSAILEEHSGALSIAYDSIIPISHLTQLINFNCEAFATKDVGLSSGLFDSAYKMVERGDADIAVTAMLRESGDLEKIALGILSIVNVVGSTAPPEYWKHLPQCVLGGHEDNSSSSNLVSRSTQLRVETIEQKCSLILAGGAWGRVPMPMVEQALVTGRLRIADAPGVTTQQDIPIFCVFPESKRTLAEKTILS